MPRSFIAIALLIVTSGVSAQTTQGVSGDDATAAISALRGELVDSFNKGDLDRLLSHLDPDVVVTWQNGEVCRGPEQVRAYYKRMMEGPQKVVNSVHCDPQVTDRHVYGDWAISWGVMNDHFVLTDGSDLEMGSKFTATIAKRGNVWKVVSCHLSVNAFDNSILRLAISKAGTWAGAIAALVGLILGLLIGRLTKRSVTRT